MASFFMKGIFRAISRMGASEHSHNNNKHIALTVNGRNLEADVDARVTLAEFLRESLDLTGTKVGCNRGECGSCTVILDGIAVYSCTMLAVEADGKEVLTIEGLGEGAELHPLQKAFIEHDALQCGYCTPGMLLSITALLQQNPRPTYDDVRCAVDGNLCRCGSYLNILDAALDASAKMARKTEPKMGRKGRS
jgi:aerobic-type carbon monoxide dehydrogenase small subunit (CoxS/CutS family)